MLPFGTKQLNYDWIRQKAQWQEIQLPAAAPFSITTSVLRLDLIDVLTGGNKWFKLAGNLLDFRNSGKPLIISFGGPFSNHIAALAAFCRREQIPVVGVIRGEKVMNRTLRRAEEMGMCLHFVSRELYRYYREKQDYSDLESLYGPAFIIPEGGANTSGISGCSAIARMIPEHFTHILLPVGTGGTMAGLCAGLKQGREVWGVQVLKAGQEKMLEQFLAGRQHVSWRLLDDFTFGGYARSCPELDDFIRAFSQYHRVPCEPVYTGKMFYALQKLLSAGSFPAGARIAVLHTGGMQYLHD
jgi:1-aminocyclopropane-1-carboxylate deaminase